MEPITQRLSSRITRAFQREVLNLQQEVTLAKVSLEGINIDQITIEDARLRVRDEKERIITVLDTLADKLATANEAEKVLDDWQSLLIDRNRFVIKEMDATAKTAERAAGETLDVLTVLKNLQMKLEDPEELKALLSSVSDETKKAAGIVLIE